MTKPLKYLSRFLGFTRSGTSHLGRLVRNFFPHRQFKRGVGIVLIGLASSVIFVHQLSNIGGVIAINTSLYPSSKPATDTTTDHTVQSPISFSYESRGLSWYHPGADLVAPTGTPVYPIMEGRIEAVNHDYFGYGNHVIVKHEGNYESLYGHLSKTTVVEGQKVSLNTVLGLSGSTGFSTGPHLHLELHQNGSIVNPAELVPGVN